MSQSLSKMYVHIIFSTKNRIPVLKPEIQTELYRYIGGICNNLECFPIQIGGSTDHVHILSVLSRKIAIMNFIKEIKTGSSPWMKNFGSGYLNFHWQDGYGAFSVSNDNIDTLIGYINRQHEHHKKVTFQDEYREFLRTYDIKYDEKYVWD
jgi:putative transposase